MGYTVHMLAALICLLAVPPTPAVMTARRAGLGTDLEIKVWLGAPSPERTAAARAVMDAAFDAIDEVEAQMSEWRPDSDVSRVNLAAGRGPVPVSPSTMQVLLRGRDVSIASDGAFDVTWRGLGGLWDFAGGPVPDPALARAVARRVDYRKLALDPERGTAHLARADMAIGLGGIAKGYAVDRAIAKLAASGFANVVVTAGGDLFATGAKGPDPWRVGIKHPRQPGHLATLDARDEAVVTSGDYERFFERDGVRYHHLLDPETGFPARGCQAVTVVARDAMSADAFATAVFVLGPDRGLALVERTSGVEALVVTEAGRVRVSSGLGGRLKWNGPAPP